MSLAEDFERDGFVVIPDLFYAHQVDAIRRDIGELIELAGHGHTMATYGHEDAALVMEGAKQLRSLYRLIGDSDVRATISELQPDFMPGIAEGGIQVRADMPNDERWRTHWHQDGTFQGRAASGLTFWTPLLPVTADMGPIEICVGSHKDDLLPIENVGPGEHDRARSYTWEIKGVDVALALSLHEVAAPLTKPGDVIVMDYRTIHRSGCNTSSVPRWSALWRFFDLRDTSMGWKRPTAFGPQA